jgi:hypothetical protein
MFDAAFDVVGIHLIGLRTVAFYETLESFRYR